MAAVSGGPGSVEDVASYSGGVEDLRSDPQIFRPSVQFYDFPKLDIISNVRNLGGERKVS